MASKFGRSRTGGKLPAVCRPYLIGLPLAYVAGVPTRLAAFARWHEPAAGWTIADSFRLPVDGGLPGWSGATGDVGLNLRVEVKRLPAPERYDITLYLRDGPAGLRTSRWVDVAILKPPPFNSKCLRNPLVLFGDFAEVHVLD